jgi:hypothetical protein
MTVEGLRRVVREAISFVRAVVLGPRGGDQRHVLGPSMRALISWVCSRQITNGH